MMNLHWVDYAILFIVGLSMMTGLIRGFVRELIALCIWVSAIWIGYHYSSEVSPYLRSYLEDNMLRQIASFVLLMLGTVLVGSILSSILSFILSRSPLKGTDRLLGMAFGFVRGTFIVALLIGVIHLTSLASDSEFRNAPIYLRFQPISTWMFSLMPSFFRQLDTLHAKDKDTHPDAVELNKD